MLLSSANSTDVVSDNVIVVSRVVVSSSGDVGIVSWGNVVVPLNSGGHTTFFTPAPVCAIYNKM